MTNSKMVFVYHYIIIFDPPNSYKKYSKILTIEYHGGERFKVINCWLGCTGVVEPKHALLILQGEESKRGGSGWLETLHFTLLFASAGHRVPAICNSCRSLDSCRSSVYVMLLKFKNLQVIVTGRKRIMSVTHDIKTSSYFMHSCFKNVLGTA